MSVDPRWQRIQSLLESLESVPLAEQAQWIEAAEADAGIRREVLELLEAMRAEAEARRPKMAAPVAVLPAQIGPYRILRRLGVGGRSVVYLAEREAGGVAQRVALKVLLDCFVEATDLRRFEREQKILAALQHPGIARFLDAGQDELQRPYLVMEWVDGQAMDEYCQSRKAGHEQKIELVVQALHAVHVAHQSLVVHLDLKPSNLLVDGQGQVKVVDFGTAKLLDHSGDSTYTRLMTPRYASPEQLSGGALSTASDIFSLAVTLHELLAGPGGEAKRSSLAMLAERAASGGVLAPTGADPDLDAILRKSTEPDPKDRYASALEFAEDLEACLERRPVRARRPTLSYQLSRFVARNRGGVSIVATLAVALLGCTGYLLYEQSQRAREARRARDTARFLTQMIESSATAQTAQPNLTVREMVERADARIEKGFAPPPDVAARLQSAFAYVLREAGREEQALEIAGRALQRADASQEVTARLLSRQTRAGILIRLGRCAEAVENFQQADAILPAARKDLEPDALSAYLQARAYAQSRCESDPKAALETLGRAAALAGLSPMNLAALKNLEALENSRLGKNTEALAAIARGLEAARSHPDGGYLQVALLRMRSQVERRAGDLAAARRSIAEAVALSPGKVNRFEELRLPLLEAGILAELKDFAAARVLAARSLGRAAEAGESAWMLHADAAEVYAKCGDCVLAMKTYEQVDQLTGGRIPKDWRGNRLFYSAECMAVKEPARAAALAREALEVYGGLLPEASARRKRLLLLSGQNN